MFLKASKLSRETIEEDLLKRDQRACRHFGPCGLGEKAIYLNSFFIDRRYYIPYTAIQRVFKRVAMSKGGFTKKGVFASIPYLVVSYDDGKEAVCNFKWERDVDRLLAALRESHPEMKTIGEKQEKEQLLWEESQKEPEIAVLTEEASRSISELKRAEDFLEKRSSLCEELSEAAKALRSFRLTSPHTRWIALGVLLLGIAFLSYGIWDSLFRHSGFAVYFVLFGFAALFFFSSAGMLPTLKRNQREVEEGAARVEKAMEDYLADYDGAFPLPARYSHPLVLKRMERAIRYGKADSIEAALAVIKEELQALNASVEVSEAEYEEVVCIKPLFLNAEYQ